MVFRYLFLPFVLKLLFKLSLKPKSCLWIHLDVLLRDINACRPSLLLFSLMFYYRFRDCFVWVTMYVMTMRLFSNEPQCAGSNLAPRVQSRIQCSMFRRYNAGPGPNAANRNLWSAHNSPRPRLVLEEIRQTKLITIKLPCLGRFQG